ncbi:unnamed protein product [Ceratitis capitata]|uniref:(Mediterranean fruit fly) hypothetical protein n=1 Tax=Ceratitis capitata TaxID=7213 RepID=A0A811VKI8_CERCA|nr:unnamed protein product [Ceratitis capitata]
MPICNKPPLPVGTANSVDEFDDHASEVAKMRHTREQAYFNSYNFDAIPVLPVEESLPKAGGSQSGNLSAIAVSSLASMKVPPSLVASNSHQHQHQQLNTLKPLYRGASSIASSSQSTRSSFQLTSSGHSSDADDSYLQRHPRNRHEHSGPELTYTYMQHIGARFARSRNASPSTSEAELGRDFLGGSGSANIETVNVGSVIVPADEIAPVHERKGPGEMSENGSFLLPRAMLKYQREFLTDDCVCRKKLPTFHNISYPSNLAVRTH